LQRFVAAVGRDTNCCHDWRHVAWRTSGIAIVPVLATGNPAPGANVSVEIEIMATCASIKAHTTAPAAKTRYVRSITLATKRPAQFGIL
jgi:hypothetical protein